MIKKRNKLLDLFFFKSWWVVLFFLFSFITYEQSIKSIKSDIFQYRNNLTQLAFDKQSFKKDNEDLNLMVNSLSDPAWIEIILMRDLGVVPEGKLKVHFTTKE